MSGGAPKMVWDPSDCQNRAVSPIPGSSTSEDSQCKASMGLCTAQPGSPTAELTDGAVGSLTSTNLEPLCPPDAADGPEAAAEYEAYIKRWVAGETLAQRWERLRARGKIAVIEDEWQDLELDVMLQQHCWHTQAAAEARAQAGQTGNRGTRRGRADLEGGAAQAAGAGAGAGMDAAHEGRRVRSRHAPKNFQDYEIDVPSAKKINRTQPDPAAGMSYSYRPDTAIMPSDGNMHDATVMVHRLSQHTRTVSGPARASEAGSDKDRPSSSSGDDDAPSSEAATQPHRYAPQQHQHVSAVMHGFGHGVPQALHGATGPRAHLGFPGLQAAPMAPAGAAGIRQPTAATGLAPLAAARGVPGIFAGRSPADLHMLLTALHLMQQLNIAYSDVERFLPVFLATAPPFTNNPAQLLHFMQEVLLARTAVVAQQQQQNQQPAEQHCQ